MLGCAYGDAAPEQAKSLVAMIWPEMVEAIVLEEDEVLRWACSNHSLNIKRLIFCQILLAGPCPACV